MPASLLSLRPSSNKDGSASIQFCSPFRRKGLASEEYGRIATAFGAKVGNSYASTEVPFFSFSCKHGWLHVNNDWVFEPVDADHTH